MKNKVKNRINIILSVLCIAASVGCLLYCRYGTWSKSTGESSKFFPKIVSIVMILVSIILIIREFMQKQTEEPPALTQVKLWHVVLLIVMCVVFFWIELYVGIIVGIFAFLFLAINLFDENPKKNWKINLLISVVATAVLWLVFNQILPIVTLNQYLF